MSASRSIGATSSERGRMLYSPRASPRRSSNALCHRVRHPAPPRGALIELDSLDQDPVDAARLAVFMYPHIEQAAETKTTPGVSRFVRSNDADAPSLTKRFLPAIATTIVTTKMIKTRR